MFSYDQRNIVPVAGASNIVVAIAVPSTLPANQYEEAIEDQRAKFAVIAVSLGIKAAQ